MSYLDTSTILKWVSLKVLSAYCNQDSIPTFPTPATPVSAYITDVPEVSNLASCAYYALSYAVQYVHPSTGNKLTCLALHMPFANPLL